MDIRDGSFGAVLEVIKGRTRFRRFVGDLCQQFGDASGSKAGLSQTLMTCGKYGAAILERFWKQSRAIADFSNLWEIRVRSLGMVLEINLGCH